MYKDLNRQLQAFPRANHPMLVLKQFVLFSTILIMFWTKKILFLLMSIMLMCGIILS